MYYLFIHKKSELQKYKSEFDRVLKAIEEGKTPVQNELRLANTVLFESFPYQILSGIFLVIGTIVLNKIKINELAKIAVVLVNLTNLPCARPLNARTSLILHTQNLNYQLIFQS